VLFFLPGEFLENAEFQYCFCEIRAVQFIVFDAIKKFTPSLGIPYLKFLKMNAIKKF